MSRQHLPVIDHPWRVRAPSNNRKLSRQRVEFPRVGKRRNIAVGDRYVCATAVAIAPTCPKCPFKDRGCFAQASAHQARLERAAVDVAPLDIIRGELARVREVLPAAMRRLGGAWDLRYHEAGDIPCTEAARLIGDNAEWALGVGIAVAWTYTHNWRSIDQRDLGPAVTLASLDLSPHLADAVSDARRRGYRPALVVPEFPRADKMFTIAGSDQKWLPCPAEAKSAVCTECRLCFDPTLEFGIAFAAHGRDRERIAGQLELMRLGLTPGGSDDGRQG